MRSGYTIRSILSFGTLRLVELEVVAGHTISGAQNIFFAQLADPNHTGLFTYGTRFFAGRFATMMFGLPAAAYAMYRCLYQRKIVKKMVVYISVVG